MRRWYETEVWSTFGPGPIVRGTDVWADRPSRAAAEAARKYREAQGFTGDLSVAVWTLGQQRGPGAERYYEFWGTE